MSAFNAAGFSSEGRVKPLEAFAGHTLFRTDSANPFLELFFQVNPATLHYKRDSTGRLSARIQAQIRVSTDTGVFFRTAFQLQTKSFDPSVQEAPKVLEQERIPLANGRFTVELYLSEEGRPDSRYYYHDTLSVAGGSPQYSSLKLLDTFYASTIPSPFLRNQMQRIPRTLNFYDEGQQQVLAYFELYGTVGMSPTADLPLRQTLFLSRIKGVLDNPALSIVDTIDAPAHIVYFQRSLSAATLPSGNYWLNVSLRNKQGIELASKSTFLQTLNKNPQQTVLESAVSDTALARSIAEGYVLDLGKTFVAKYDMAQLRAILKMIRPAADGTEQSAIHGFLQRPDELYTRYFIYNHFAAINKAEPGKAWKEFSDVVREVNRRFGSGSTPGYETERGIIYLRYGKPDEEVRAPNESGALRYEIWRYNPNPKMMGPGLFLFYSPGSMSSDFRLLHSTVRGETQNQNWRSVLYSTGRSSGNTNARAEEYFGRQ